MFHRRPKREDTGGFNFRVHQPPMLPFGWRSWCRAFNRATVSRVMRDCVQAHSAGRTVVVTTVPNACDYVDAVPSDMIVYYCVDDFSEWPGLDRENIRQMEQALVKKVDCCLATSPALPERLSVTGKPTILLSHGVDIDLFGTPSQSLHPCLSGIPSPRVGYFGLFDEWSDQDLLRQLARAMPDVAFVITGRVEVDTRKLAAEDNVFFTGSLPYSELPALVSGLSALLLPYKLGALSKSLSPLKLKEYLVTGRPVISSPIAAAREMQEIIMLAESPEQWAACIREAMTLDTERLRSEMIERFKSESWSAKASQFMQICGGENVFTHGFGPGLPVGGG